MMDILRVLEIVHNLADGNCLDQEVEAVEDGDDLEHEAFEQRQAITQFAEFIEEFKSQTIGA